MEMFYQDLSRAVKQNPMGHAVRRSGKLVSGQKTGRSPRSSHFTRKVILNSVQNAEQLLLSHMQARSVIGS